MLPGPEHTAFRATAGTRQAGQKVTAHADRIEKTVQARRIPPRLHLASFPGIFTGRVVVTLQHVVIDRALRRTRVPRHLVVGVDVDLDMLTGSLIVHDAAYRRKIAVPAVVRRYAGDPTTVVRRQRRDGSELTGMLATAPAGPPGGELEVQLQPVNLAIAIGFLCLLLWVVFIGASSASLG